MKIKLIVYDFDGVMTNNKAFVDENGKEFVEINRSDGLGVSEFKKLDLEQMIMSSEKNKVVEARAKKLDIKVMHGIEDKKNTLISFCEENNIQLKQVLFVGNDINDEEAMKISGYAYCPLDSHARIKKISDHILTKKGGSGVIRELYDIIKDKLSK